MDTVDTKKERIEEVLATRMLSRLPQIVWGKNCTTVREALTFPEDWLLQDFSLREKNDALEYLGDSENGFKLKWAIKSELKIRRWILPEKPVGVFLEVRVQFENSYYLAVRDLEERVESVLISFLDYRQTLLVERTENILYRELLIKKIEECNKYYSLPAKRVKNIWFLNPERMKITYQLTFSGSSLYASKGQDVSRYVCQQEQHFNSTVGSCIGSFFSSCNRYFFNRFDTCKNVKLIKTYMPARCFEVIKNLLSPCGFLLELMPQHSESLYKEISYKIEGDIPVYITLHKVKYIYRVELNREFNLNLQRICEQISSLS